MIITDIKQLRDVTVGEDVTLVLEFKTVRTDLNSENPCRGCVFSAYGCDFCSSLTRPDKAEVKFLKI